MDSPGYEVGFIYTFFATVGVVLYASAVDGLFISFAINLRAHFQELQMQIEQLAFDRTERHVQRQLIQVVEYHVQLLGLAKELRLIYTPIVFGQFFITSIQVGVIIYQIMTVRINIDMWRVTIDSNLVLVASAFSMIIFLLLSIVLQSFVKLCFTKDSIIVNCVTIFNKTRFLSTKLSIFLFKIFIVFLSLFIVYNIRIFIAHGSDNGAARVLLLFLFDNDTTLHLLLRRRDNQGGGKWAPTRAMDIYNIIISSICRACRWPWLCKPAIGIRPRRASVVP